MTAVRIFCSIMCMLIVSAPFAAIFGRPNLLADDFFDSYGNIPWEDEKAHLDNFAYELQHDENLVGYIIVYAGRRSCVGEAKDRALRAKNYLMRTRGIQGNRVRLIDGGYREELRVILQPIPHNAPGLVPSPTIKPSDADVRDCKQKSTKRKIRGS